MRLRSEHWLGIGLVGALALMALLWGAPDRAAWGDRRPSIAHAGPYGAKGLAALLRQLGVQVRTRRRPLFDLARDSGPPRRDQVAAFLDIGIPTLPELAAVPTSLAPGSRPLVAQFTAPTR